MPLQALKASFHMIDTQAATYGVLQQLLPGEEQAVSNI